MNKVRVTTSSRLPPSPVLRINPKKARTRRTTVGPKASVVEPPAPEDQTPVRSYCRSWNNSYPPLPASGTRPPTPPPPRDPAGSERPKGRESLRFRRCMAFDMATGGVGVGAGPRVGAGGRVGAGVDSCGAGVGAGSVLASALESAAALVLALASVAALVLASVPVSVSGAGVGSKSSGRGSLGPVDEAEVAPSSDSRMNAQQPTPPHQSTHPSICLPSPTIPCTTPPS